MMFKDHVVMGLDPSNLHAHILPTISQSSLHGFEKLCDKIIKILVRQFCALMLFFPKAENRLLQIYFKSTQSQSD